MDITKSIKYIGVNDRQIDLFEGQYIVPNGMCYNSYVIIDDKIAVFDTVDGHFGDVWMNNLKTALNGRTPDYLIVQHMEPDHSANILLFADEFKNATIVSSAKSFTMMKNFFNDDFSDRRIVVKEWDKLNLGSHTLNFVMAPMVHWPEVMMTYEESEKVFFSADAFGKFGAMDTDEDWACEARRYYIGIVGKYGMQVQALFKKIANLEINTICALHGPILRENLGYYLGLYNTWSSYQPESKGVVINFTSVYGNTRKAVMLLKDALEAKGVKVTVNDLARCDMAEAVEDTFRYDKIVFATTTYNAEIFPFMQDFIHRLTERNFSNKTVGMIENGTWAPVAIKYMMNMLEKCKNITYTENNVRILSAVKDENVAQINALADELAK